MLERDEIADWAARFGVAPDQVIKDHLVSHLLFGLSTIGDPADLVFYGGTALSRTHLTELRLSEDIDLWTDDTPAALRVLETEIPRAVRREFPSLSVESIGSSARIVSTRSGLQVRVQVMSYSTEYRQCIEQELQNVVLRYSDLPEAAALTVPSLGGFVAMKHLAWVDRAAPRDLVDLNGLADLGALGDSANSRIECLRGFGVRPHEVAEVPRRTNTTWETDLSHQMRSVPEPDEALERVRHAWARSLDWRSEEE